MNKEEIIINIPVKNIIDIKYYLSDSIKKNIKKLEMSWIEKSEDKYLYKFRFQDFIESQIYNVELTVYEKDSVLEKLSIMVLKDSDGELNDYEIKIYCLKKIMDIQQAFSTNSLNKYTDKYCIRVYYYYLSDLPLIGESEISFQNRKILFKSLNAYYSSEYLSEQVVTFDINVEAININDARSQALNISKEVSSILSVILNIGFINIVYHIRKAVTVNDELQVNEVIFDSGIIDDELQLVVYDNMNGLYTYGELREMRMNPFSKFSFIELNDVFITNDSNSSKLEDVFKNHRIKKNKKNVPIFTDNILYEKDLSNDGIPIPKDIRKIFRNINKLKEEDLKSYRYFKNSCHLYNISLTHGMHEPTLMISYMVAAIETLAKASNIESYNKFMIQYLDNYYEEKFIDFLYSKIRSGHFHSGEFIFRENENNMDITLDKEFNELRKIYIKSINILRRAFVNWINVNLTKEDEDNKDKAKTC